ncbi:hypothetical protein HYT25_00840 [Candidatus Pacearchaeota archaeon]|nr:hypothetical protein [Candidatus Pacearchaeota archaeon]
MNLDGLVTKAECLKQTGQHDDILARDLSVAATSHFGLDNRSPEFIKLIQLSKSIRGKKEKHNWETAIDIFDTQTISRSHGTNAYFFASGYGSGKIDLMKDGKIANTLYGILVNFSPLTNINLPFLHNLSRVDLSPFRHYNRFKQERGLRLLNEIRNRVGFKPSDGCLGLISEDSWYNTPLSDIGLEKDGTYHIESYPIENGKLKTDAESMRKFVYDNLELISNLFAKSHLNVRQVGRVIDGGKRYKR